METGQTRLKLLVAILMVALLAGGFVLVAVVAGGDDEADTTSASPPNRSQIDDLVDELLPFVESSRGLKFKDDVDVTLANDSQLHKLMLADLEDDREDLEKTAVSMRALGLIASDFNLFDAVASFLDVGILGLYEPETNLLVVRGTRITPLVRITLVHELTHALDDQHFELGRPELEDKDDETNLGLLALAEGVADHVEQEFRATLSAEERSEAESEEADMGGEVRDALAKAKIPDIVIALLTAPHAIGPRLVQAILDAEGTGRLNEAIRTPPTTSEQMLLPERFLKGEPAQQVPVPQASGEVIDSGVFGQFDLNATLLLGGGTGSPLSREEQMSALQASVGWGGDAYVVWRDGPRECMRATFVMDTPSDLDELVTALKTWASGRTGVDVDPEPDRVTMTACNAKRVDSEVDGEEA